MSSLLGVNIGGTKSAIVLGQRMGEETITIIDKITFPTDHEKGPEYTVDKILFLIEELLDKHSTLIGSINAVGVICGGPLDSRLGIIKSPPNLIGWDDVPIVNRIEDRFGIEVRLQNDANACAIAEWRYGAARGCRDVVFLTFGTGMGAGLILGDKLYSGANNMAGEVGHVRLSTNGPVGYGKAGSFEGFCSGGGLAQLARMMVLERFQMGQKVGFCTSMEQLPLITAKSIAEAADEGDPLAREIYVKSGEYLGRGISMIIDFLNPEIIVIGGIFAKNTHLLWPAAEVVIKRESLSYSLNSCRIVPSSLGDEIEDYAALSVAMEAKYDE